jgi:S-methylmethionine-dependent homocysteine/selenocysteine methylase/SAM-dependent methyltransferase
VAATPPVAAVRAGYAHVAEGLARDRCIVLDGGVATELQKLGARPSEGGLWGSAALYKVPRSVYEVHRRYAEAGCDVVSTNTWALLSSSELSARAGDVTHWMDVARSAVRLAREAVADAGREGRCAVAYSMSDDVTGGDPEETVALLRRVWEDEPPDLVLLETLTLVREPLTFDVVALLVESGLPLWLSFRRCRHGVCGVYGEHWGPPEGDLFGRAARRFEELGVQALLVNCLPVDHVPGMLSWLRDFTDLPLGAYPNLGRLAGPSWRFDEDVTPERYAELALEWREEGAAIVGGCCGVGPEHLAAAGRALDGVPRGTRRREPLTLAPARRPGGVPPPPWRDEQGREVAPLPFPEIVVDPGVFVPTQGSYLVWKHLFRESIGAGKRCVDVGCGCGILAIQLARNGASDVTAVDIDPAAVANTLANAYRCGVADRVHGEAFDLYQWEPDERFDVVVASLYQMPVDPFQEPSGHRPLDYWGRSLLDHFLRRLPALLAPDGLAYVMQLSIIGQLETQRLLADGGLEARVADFGFFPFGPVFAEHRSQILRVEESSDAHHLQIGGEDVMVAYLLEVRRAAT